MSKGHLHAHKIAYISMYEKEKSRYANKNPEIPRHMTNKSSIRKLQLAIAAITGEDPHRAPVDARIHQPSSAAPVPGRKSSHEGAALPRTLALPAASCVAQTVAALHCPSEAMPNSAIVNSCDSYDPKEKSFPAQ